MSKLAYLPSYRDLPPVGRQRCHSRSDILSKAPGLVLSQPPLDARLSDRIGGADAASRWLEPWAIARAGCDRLRENPGLSPLRQVRYPGRPDPRSVPAVHLVAAPIRRPLRGASRGLRAHDEASEYLRRRGLDPICLGRGPFSPAVATDLLRLVRRDRPHVLHAHGYASSNFARIVSMLTGVRTIVHEHATFPAYLRTSDRSTGCWRGAPTLASRSRSLPRPSW